MIDVNLLKNNIEFVKEKLKLKKFYLDVDKFVLLENNRKKTQSNLENLRQIKNNLSKQINLNKNFNLIEESKLISIKIKDLENELFQIQDDIKNYNSFIPNIPLDDVCIGYSEEDNVEKYSNNLKDYDSKIIDNNSICEILGQVDFNIGAKISGSKHYVMKQKIAKLYRSLGQFMLDYHIDNHGYTEVYVPYIVNDDSIYGTGQLPKFEQDLFKLTNGQYLIPTAEVPLTNLHKNEILDKNILPLKYVSLSPCFRVESGGYGKDSKGLMRVHQFDKVELVQIVEKEKSNEAFFDILNHAKTILEKLELPYRIVELCTGDLGFASAKTYDLEVFFNSQKQFREVSSVSNMTDFQSRRLNIKVKNNNKNDLVHTLNGSGLAVGRILIAILENYQKII